MRSALVGVGFCSVHAVKAHIQAKSISNVFFMSFEL